jgi:SAM-dependent methyltransferase
MRMLIYRWKESLKRFVPVGVKKWVLHRLGWHISRNRRETNCWLRAHAAAITGDVISLGSGSDSDKEGRHYRDYFTRATSYTTADLNSERGADLQIDIRAMPHVSDAAYDAVLCNSVLEHVDNYRSGLAEITRVLKPGGILLLNVPFRQALHLEPYDFWRFTSHGLRYLLEPDYEIVALDPIDLSVPNFPASYWVEARKRPM